MIATATRTRIQYLDEAGERRTFNCEADTHGAAMNQFRFACGAEVRPQFTCDENGFVTLHVAPGLNVQYRLGPDGTRDLPDWLHRLLQEVLSS